MSVARCVLCDSTASEPVVQERGYQLVRCLACGLMYVESPPSQAALQRSYETDQAASVEVTAQMRLSAKKLRIASKDLDWIQKYVRRGTLLEVGCGAGYFLWAARQRGFEVNGFELNNRLVEYGRQQFGLDLSQGSLSEAQLLRKSYDVIYMRNVLSHLLTPVQDFQIIHDLLADDGHLFFETGNGAELSREMLEQMMRWNQLGIPDHLFFYSGKNIQQLAGKVGLRVVSAVRYSMALHDWIARRAEHRVRRTLSEVRPSSRRGQSKEKLVAAFSYFLTYRLGRILPKAGRHCTIQYVCQKERVYVPPIR